MKLRDVPYWLQDRDHETCLELLDHDVILDYTDTQEHTHPFDDKLTFMMVPIYMQVGMCAFPPVIMVPQSLSTAPSVYANGYRQLSGAHRLRAAFFAGLTHIPAYIVQEK